MNVNVNVRFALNYEVKCVSVDKVVVDSNDNDCYDANIK